MSTDPPKRYESTELTVVRPRDSLPPTSTVAGMTIEQLADVARARRDAQDDVDTLVACPGCSGCTCCKGEHMVSAERAASWRRGNPEPPPEAA